MTTLHDVLPKMESVPPERRHSEVDHGLHGSETTRARERDDMRAHASRVGVGVGGVLAVSLALLAACATSPPAVTSHRERDENACVLASVGFNDRGTTDLPFNIDRDAYRRCLEERGYRLSPSGIQAP